MNKRIILLVCVLLIGFASVAPVAANETADAEEWDEHFESTDFEFSNGVELTDVQIENDEALVYLDVPSSAAADDVILTDGTQTTTGEIERQTHTLQEGQNVYSVNLENPNNRFSKAGISIETGNQAYQWVDESTTTPDDVSQEVSYPFVLTIIGMLLVFTGVVGLYLLKKRNTDGSKSVVRP